MNLKNAFSKDSDVTVVITSCGRLDLLKKTLSSFLQYNDYPVKKIIITEDSGDGSVYDLIPEDVISFFDIIVNKENLGQIKCVDMAYSKVDTPYIFHCEDDWEFYRPGFIEESMKLLTANPKTLQVWLRSFMHDIAIHSPYHFLKERVVIDNIPFYQIGSNKEDWQGFSFNPGLRRLSDYKKIGTYSSFPSEKKLSRYYADSGYHAVILENDAVLHTGFERHTVDIHERKKKLKKKKIDNLKMILISVMSFLLGVLLEKLL